MVKRKQELDLDSLRYQNIQLRVTLSKTIWTLIPCAIFVINSHLFLYLECLNIEILLYIPVLLISGLISLFFLIYCYALVMNGKAVELYQKYYKKVDEAKSEEDKIMFMHKIGWESIYFGLAVVNFLYLFAWCFMAFGILKYLPGMMGYFFSSLGASLICLAIFDYKYGEIA